MGFKSDIKAKTKEFVPSTSDDLKRYRKNGKKLDEQKAARKGEQRKSNGKRNPDSALEMRKLLLAQQEVRIFKDNFFDKLVEFCKERGAEAPAYRSYLKREEADAFFMFDMQHAISQLPWCDLSLLVRAVTSRVVVTRDNTEAIHMVVYLL
jgi:hypothetical protein